MLGEEFKQTLVLYRAFIVSFLRYSPELPLSFQKEGVERCERLLPPRDNLWSGVRTALRDCDKNQILSQTNTHIFICFPRCMLIHTVLIFILNLNQISNYCTCPEEVECSLLSSLWWSSRWGSNLFSLVLICTSCRSKQLFKCNLPSGCRNLPPNSSIANKTASMNICWWAGFAAV